MRTARPLEASERVVYAFLADDPLIQGMTQWLDRAVVRSGDSVTVISTFARDRLARVDVMYSPSVALRSPCSLCLALEEEYGKPTTVDSSGFARVSSWAKWKCCEVRLQYAAITFVVSYRDRDLLNDAKSDIRHEQINKGKQQLR